METEESATSSRRDPVRKFQNSLLVLVVAGFLMDLPILVGGALIVRGIVFFSQVDWEIAWEYFDPRRYEDTPRGEVITIYRDFYYIRPHLIARLLESEGIWVAILDEEMGSMRWANAQAVGGTKVVVQKEDLEKARAALGRALEENRHRLICCPRCDSSSIEYRRFPLVFFSLTAVISFLWSGASMMFFLPSPIRRRRRKRWRCLNCGKRWRHAGHAKHKRERADQAKRK